MTPTMAAASSARLLPTVTTAPLFGVDDGAFPELVVLPEVVVAAADEVAADEDVRVALLMVVFRRALVPVAALPLAPTPVPTMPVPTTPVPTGAAVVVELALTIGLVVEFLLGGVTMPEDGDEATEAVDEREAELEDEEALELDPPVKVTSAHVSPFFKNMECVSLTHACVVGRLIALLDLQSVVLSIRETGAWSPSVRVSSGIASQDSDRFQVRGGPFLQSDGDRLIMKYQQCLIVARGQRDSPIHRLHPIEG